MDMLKPAIEPRRRRGPTLMVSLAFVAGALVGVGGSLAGFLLAPQRVVVIEGQPQPTARPVVVQSEEPPTGPLTARVSPRSQTIDLLSPDVYRADGTVDEVFDVELTTPLAMQHIFLNGNGGSHQWDTVIGATSIPFGRVFGGNRGDATWHLGVREDGAWITSSQTGALGSLTAGAHRLELIATGVPDGPGPRTVTVMFVDGTTVTAPVAPRVDASKFSGCGNR